MIHVEGLNLPKSYQVGQTTMRTRRTSLLLIGFLGAGLALTLFFVLWGLRSRHDWPELTVDDFDRAWEHWQKNSPENYDIYIQVTGRQPAIYEISVREREVILAVCNGDRLKSKRTWGTWSVPGMFQTIEHDLERLAEFKKNQRAGPPPLLLHVQFDQVHGYPGQYHRLELGTQMQVDWKVTEFRVVHK